MGRLNRARNVKDDILREPHSSVMLSSRVNKQRDENLLMASAEGWTREDRLSNVCISLCLTV
jgi:hypothetical protein